MAKGTEQRLSPVVLPIGPGGGAGKQRTGERAKNARGTMGRLLIYFRSYRISLVLVFLFATMATVLALSTPYLIGKAIDQLSSGNPATLFKLVLILLTFNITSMAAELVQGVLIARVSQRAMRSLREQLFNHMQKLSLKFFDTQRQGELMSRLTNDMDVISQVLTTNIAQLFTGVLTIIGVLSIIFLISPWLALGSMVAFPLMIGLVGLVGRKTRVAFRSYQTTLGQLNSVLEETYSGQRVVLAFGQEKQVLDRFKEPNDQVREVGIKAMTVAMLVMPMMGILSNLNVAILCGLGGFLAIKGLVTIGTIAAFINYSRKFAEPLRQLGNLYNQVQGALAGAERIFALLDTDPDQEDPPGTKELTTVAGEVIFENLSFSYKEATPVLKSISFHANPGERIALVGHTGAGKTTLINLLSRFYDYEEGRILIDGVDIKSVSRDSVRQKLGVVLQQSFLFSESVLENIRYGRLGATDEEVFAAAKLAHADGFILQLHAGYQTILSERGGNLSEGQRQLLTIARAILADPAILILDEATSSVDTRTEALIQQGLSELMKGRTSFVIAHRLSTISTADKLIVIDGGRVIEEGSHQELLDRKGIYHRLYMSQFRLHGAETSLQKTTDRPKRQMHQINIVDSCRN